MKTATLWVRSILGLVGVFSVMGAGGLCPGGELKPDEVEEIQEELYGWSIRSYRIPADRLAYGIFFESKGELTLPKMPPENAEALEVRAFIKSSSEVLAEFLKQEGIVLPDGSLAVFDQRHEVLAVRTTGEMHSLVRSLEDDYLNRVPQMIAFRVDVLEAGTKEVLKVIDEAVGKADHSPFLERLETQAAAGKGRVLGTSRVDTRSGQRVKITATTHTGMGAKFEIGEDETGGAGSRESRETGTVIEIEPVMGNDGSTINLNYSLDHHLAPPTVRQVPVATVAGRRVEIPVTDLHTARTLTSTVIVNGQCRIMGVWQATGDGPAGKQVVAFLTGKIVHLLEEESPRALNFLRMHGEKVVTTPPKVIPKVDPNMILRRFRMPSDFLSYGVDDGRAEAADPFAEASPKPRAKTRATAAGILEAQGVLFPPGSFAIFNPVTGELTVRNLPRNMNLVEAFIDSIRWGPRLTIRLLLHIVQGDGAMFRKLDRAAMGQADHASTWKAIEKELAAGRVSLVRTAWIETRSGQRAKSSAATEYTYATGFEFGDGKEAPAPGEKEKPGAPAITNREANRQGFSPEFDFEEVGLVWEIDPVLGNDGYTMDFNTVFSLDTAPPTERFAAPAKVEGTWRIDSPTVDFHESTVSTAQTTRTGMKRLLGLWKPKGMPELEAADVLQAAFLEARIVEIRQRSGE